MRILTPIVSQAVRPWSCGCAAVLALSIVATAQQQTVPPPAPASQTTAADGSPTIRSGVTLVRTDVIVRDEDGAFLADLRPEDFIVKEDGVQQEVVSLVLVLGGRVYNQLLPPSPVQEGIILPTKRPTNDTAGRIIIFFVDEMHLERGLTPKLRHFIKRVGDILIHDGDLMGLITNGPGGTEVDLTYDRALLYSTAQRLMGNGFTPRELVEDLQEGRDGPAELMWRAHRAFWTVHQLIEKLEGIEDRRKVILYVSTGYDLNPFALQRLHRDSRADRFLRDDFPTDDNPIVAVERAGAVFADGELIQELDELTAAANRANATFYTMDPRGLLSGPDIDYDVPIDGWGEYTRATRSSLRSLAELTGGMSIVNTNNFDELLGRIDAETSDYYVVGYYTNNPDGRDRMRELDISVNREDVEVRSRTSYTFARESVETP